MAARRPGFQPGACTARSFQFLNTHRLYFNFNKPDRATGCPISSSAPKQRTALICHTGYLPEKKINHGYH